MQSDPSYCPFCWERVEASSPDCPKCGFPGRELRWLDYSPNGLELGQGKYRLVEPLGAGGFGFTARAVQQFGSRPLGSVAVKTLYGAGDEGEVEQALGEAAAIRAVSHPNIVVLHDLLFDARGIHLVMEYVDGYPLDVVVRAKESMSIDFAVRVGVQISSALSDLHAKGVIHCDLTPHNIALLSWLAPEPQFVKILDFGIACAWRRGVGFKGAGAGTPGFCAPEQLLGSPSQRSDVFSLGVILFWLLTGKLPYSPELWSSPEQLANAPVPRLAGSIPPELADVVRHCLEPDEAKRYPAMPKRDLERFQAVGLTEVEEPATESRIDPKALLEIAKETFLSAGLAPTGKEKKELYLRAAQYFEQAERAGNLPRAFKSMAEKARRYAESG